MGDAVGGGEGDAMLPAVLTRIVTRPSSDPLAPRGGGARRGSDQHTESTLQHTRLRDTPLSARSCQRARALPVWPRSREGQSRGVEESAGSQVRSDGGKEGGKEGRKERKGKKKGKKGGKEGRE